MKQFAKTEVVSLYLPLLAFLVLYKYIFAFPWFNNISNTAYFYHATLLSIFQQNVIGPYDLHHLWFLPVLLVFMLLFMALERMSGHLSVQILVVALLFLGNCQLWRFNSPWMLSEGFALFLINYAAGFWTAKAGKLDAIRKRRMLLIGAALYVLLFLTPEWVSLEQYWLRHSILALLSTLAFVSLFTRVRVPSLVRAISSSTLMIYLLEPRIRYEIEQRFAIDFLRTPLQDMLLPMALRIIATLFVGFVAQTIFNEYLKRPLLNWHVSKRSLETITHYGR
ncbi:MAG: acyltransferase family protein [Candidatus Bathyarchaeia archaeon]